MAKKKIVTVHGIRPDLIRMSLILKKFHETDEFEIVFIWSGQHYSDNLKDIFFRELNIPKPNIELNAGGETDTQTVASIITKLTPILEELEPNAVCFLGDTNTVMGCLSAAMLNLPIVHIEGCMRSYDWRMPEEKYRITIDHLSDVIYTYFDEYKQQGVSEGLNPNNIVVVTNLIVDILDEYYFKRKSFYDEMATPSFFQQHGIKKGEYYLMTCHRRENVHDRQSFENILNLIAATDRMIYFPASYRTQKVMKNYGLSVPDNVIMTDPIGYNEMITLMTNSRGVITDSGSVIEETAVLNIPAIQMRKSTERPQVYDCGSSVKFDPTLPEQFPFDIVYEKLESLHGKSWNHNLGDGKASQRVVDDLFQRVRNNKIKGHEPQNYHLDIRRSYIDDGL
jgi:UDP-N-acetylglucosamine 2-epimerase (non-hydrolysing)